MTNAPSPQADVVTAAMSVARDAAEGRLDPAALEQQAAAELRELVGTVVGAGDPLWELQRDIARQVLALDGVSVDELAEWLAVSRQRAGESVSAPDPDQTPPEPVAPVSGAHSAGTVPFEEDDADVPAADDVPDSAPVALAVVPPSPPSPQPVRYDPMAAWAAGSTRRY